MALEGIALVLILNTADSLKDWICCLVFALGAAALTQVNSAGGIPPVRHASKGKDILCLVRVKFLLPKALLSLLVVPACSSKSAPHVFR